jgi:hypothetical protein
MNGGAEIIMNNGNHVLSAVIVALALGFACPAGAKLPPLTDDQKEKAAEAKFKAAEGDRKAAELLCKTYDQVAARYASEQKAKGTMVKPVAVDCAIPPAPTPPGQQAQPAGAPAAPAGAKPAEPAKAAAAPPAAAPKK